MSPSDPRDAATFTVLLGLLVLAGGLLGLMAMVAPHVLGIMLIVGGFLGCGAVHYVVWGWWLGPLLSKQEGVDRRDVLPDKAKPARGDD
jgi:hypothetical protein